MMEIKDFLKVLWTSITGGKKIKGGVSSERAENLNFFSSLRIRKLKPVIDRSLSPGKDSRSFSIC